LKFEEKRKSLTLPLENNFEDLSQGEFKYFHPHLIFTRYKMSKYVLALATCAISSAFAAPDALRFQGVSATVGATPADAPTVDPSTQSKFSF
jgi:hypothetical protein